MHCRITLRPARALVTNLANEATPFGKLNSLEIMKFAKTSTLRSDSKCVYLLRRMTNNCFYHRDVLSKIK